MHQAGRLQETHEAFKDKVDFYMVYLREAHPTDGWRPARHIEIEDPKNFGDRAKVAKQCSKALELSVPFLVDDMQDSVGKAYHAHPDRLFILDADGKVAYRGARGPRGFKVEQMEQALKKIIAPAPVDTESEGDE